MSSSDDYRSALCEAMGWLAEKPDTVFMGQAVEYPGTAMFGTLGNVPMEKRIEMPVAEDMQMGMSIGLALSGYVPITIYPRWNFLLLATNQLMLHLDKLVEYSHGGYDPKVIIRTAVASRKPLDPQAQHYGNFTDAFKMMLRNVHVFEIFGPSDIFVAYKEAYESPGSWLIVEHTEDYA